MAITYKDINLLSQKASVAGTEKLPVSDTEYITPSQITSGLAVDSGLVHTTGNETIGGDKTFSDDIVVGDASNIKYGASSGEGFTVARDVSTYSGSTLQLPVANEPKAFIISASRNYITDYSGATVIGVVGDSTGCHGVYTTGTQHNYGTFTKSYSNGVLSITAPSGVTFEDIDWSIVYYYGTGTLTFRTAQVQPGSGATSVTFTGTGLTEIPVMYAVMLESQVNNESYRRVAYYTNEGSGFGDPAAQAPFGVSFYSSQIHNTTSSFSVSYNNGLVINSGGTNAGGYFHNPGTYVLYYLMASDVSGGGGYSSLGDELDAIRTDIGDIQTLLEAI